MESLSIPQVQDKEVLANNRGFDILFGLWVIMLFLPERLIAYYIPALLHLRSLPTLLLALALLVWWRSDTEKYRFKWLGLFLISLLLSSVFAENTGRARLVLRIVLEYYLLARITFSFIDNREKTDRILFLIVLHFLYLGIWGLIGGGKITWDYILNEEDAYGPFMGIGVAYCYQYFLSQGKGWLKTIALMSCCICLIGVVISFARGAFLVLLCILLYFLIKSRNPLKGLILIGAASLVIIVAVSILFPGNAFWKEMQSATEGISSGTGRDRKVLWSIAWEEYKDNAIIGVGPLNFGVAAPRYLSKVTDRRDYRPDTIWGRAAHNAFFQILCELGTVGFFVFVMILYDFFKTNRISMRIRPAPSDSEGSRESLEQTNHVVLGIRITMIAFLMNAFFYDIIYYSWFWILLIINRMLYINRYHRRLFDKPLIEVKS